MLRWCDSTTGRPDGRGARRDHERTRADVAGVGKLRMQARLLSPVDGVVSARLVEPGTTVVADGGLLWNYEEQ